MSEEEIKALLQKQVDDSTISFSISSDPVFKGKKAFIVMANPRYNAYDIDYVITVDGKEIPHFLHRRKFEEAECGWYYSQTLKSVQVKYLNPKKDHQVVVSFEQFDLIGM